MSYRNISIFIFLMLGSFFSRAQIVEQSGESAYIEFRASATELILPDEIYLEVRLVENGRSKLKLPVFEQEQNLARALQAVGIPSDRLSKSGSQLGFVSVFWISSKERKEADYSLLLKSPEEIQLAFAIFDSLQVEKAEITRSSHSQMDSLMLEVKLKALRIGQYEAQKMVEVLGKQLGGPISISDQRSSGTVNFIDGVKVRGASRIPSTALVGYETPEQIEAIELEKIKIEYSFLIRFKII